MSEQLPLFDIHAKKEGTRNMSDMDKIRQRLVEIKNQGYIRTHRAHDTGIGKTLEDELGITENNLRLPDIGEIELKAKRIDSQSMLTLATKSPDPKGVNRVLFEEYKYPDDEGHYNLHSTVYGSRYNPQGFKVSFKDSQLVLENRNDITAFWPATVFSDVLKSKSDKVLLIFALSKGKKQSLDEYFHYNEAYLLNGLNGTKFGSAIENDKLKIDIRIGDLGCQ